MARPNTPRPKTSRPKTHRPKTHRPRLARVLIGLLTASSCVLTGACAFGPPPPDQSGAAPRLPTPSASPTPSQPAGGGATIEVIAKKLRTPWGIAFLPDGSGLVTERESGKILRLAEPAGPDGLTVTTAATVTGLSTSGDRGLLGIAVSPHYASDSTVFVYYSTTKDNRIASMRLDGKPRTILTGIPAASTDNGGGLAFGPDGYLYASTGDAGRASRSQDKKSLAGKILRMTTTGKPAPGNPTRGSLVYAYGFHDVEGFAWDSSKRLYAMDTAPKGKDSLVTVGPGKNHGWSAPSGATTVKPMLTWTASTSTCSGVAVVETTLATACLNGKRMWIIRLTALGGTFGAPVPALTSQFGRLRTVATGPDGSLWITTSNTDGHGTPGRDDDQVIRIVISGAGAGKS